MELNSPSPTALSTIQPAPLESPSSSQNSNCSTILVCSSDLGELDEYLAQADNYWDDTVLMNDDNAGLMMEVNELEEKNDKIDLNSKLASNSSPNKLDEEEEDEQVSPIKQRNSSVDLSITNSSTRYKSPSIDHFERTITSPTVPTSPPQFINRSNPFKSPNPLSSKLNSPLPSPSQSLPVRFNTSQSNNLASQGIELEEVLASKSKSNSPNASQIILPTNSIADSIIQSQSQPPIASTSRIPYDSDEELQASPSPVKQTSVPQIIQQSSPALSPRPSRSRSPLNQLSPVPSTRIESSPPPIPSPLPEEPEVAGYGYRSLRQRTAAQLNPYSIENAQYTKTMVKNGWQGAVVIGPKVLEQTEEQLRIRKELAELNPKDNLGGWLEFEPGQFVKSKLSQEGRNRNSDEESYDGDAMLEREARRKALDLEIESAFGGVSSKSKGKRKENDFIDRSVEGVDREHHQIKRRLPKQLLQLSKGNGSTSTKQSNSSSKKRSRVVVESNHSRGFSSEGDSSPRKAKRNKSHQRADSEPLSSPVASNSNNSTNTAKTKKRKRHLHQESVNHHHRQLPSIHLNNRATDHIGTLERDLLALSSPLRSVHPSQRSSEDSNSEEDEEEEEEEEDDSDNSVEVIDPILEVEKKTKLGGKKKRALGMMMPAVFMKKAQADLKLMEKEKLGGYNSGSDEGSGDAANYSSSSDEERIVKGKGIMKRGSKRDLDDFIHKDQDIFTDESGDEGRLQPVEDSSSQEDEGDSVSSWLHSFAPRRQAGQDEDIVDRFLRKAKTKRSSSSKIKRIPSGITTNSKSKKSSKANHNESSKNQRSEIRSIPAFNHRPVVKPIPLNTDRALFEEVPSIGRASSTTANYVEVRQRLIPEERLEPIAEIESTGAKTTTNPIPSENEHWATYSKFSHDFDIKRLRPGIQFPTTSFIGSGQLFNLVSSSTTNQTPILPRFCRAFEFSLNSSMTSAELEGLFPPICDSLFIDITRTEESDNSTDETFKFLGNYILEVLPTFENSTIVQFSTSLLSELDQLNFRIEFYYSSTNPLPPSFNKKWLMLSWYFVDLLARIVRVEPENSTYQDRFRTSMRSLIKLLISHGPEHTTKSLKTLATLELAAGEQLIIHDPSVECWLGLISLALSNVEGLKIFEAVDFWEMVIEEFTKTLPKSTLKSPVGGEILSYTATMLCAISQFSSTGFCTSSPKLPAHWSIITRTLELIQPASLSKSDHTTSNTALARRDRYLWTLFARCLVFTERWNWIISTKDELLPKLFDLVNARRLSDLTIERESDFPTFLQTIEQINQPVILNLQDTMFVIFLKILIKTASYLSNVSIDDKRKQLTRLFLRLSPMTTGPWARNSMEINRGTSILINHYSLYMTFAALSPYSAKQRLDQAQRLINFSEIDEEPRKISIRAILYFTLIFKQNNIPITPFVEWLSTLATQLRIEYVDLDKELQTKSRASGRAGEVATRVNKTALWNRAVFITMVLRSVQLILRWSNSSSILKFPDLELLQPAWTTQLLESPLALDPMIGREIFKCIECFLELRLTVMHPPREEEPAGVSQDEFGMFEIDYADPALNAMLGVEVSSQSTTQSENKVKDVALAKFIATSLSPSIFRLFSNIYVTTNVSGAGPVISDRTAYAETAVECWTRCIIILVQNGLANWSTYLQWGNQSWRRLSDGIGKREIGLLLAIRFSNYDQSIAETYSDEFLDIWFQTIIFSNLVNQHSLTSILLNMEKRSPLLSDVPYVQNPDSNEFEIDLVDLKNNRIGLLTSIIKKAEILTKATFQIDKNLSKISIMNFIRGMLQSMLDSINIIPNEIARIEYSNFCKIILNEIKLTGCFNEQNLPIIKLLNQAVN